MFRWSDDTVKKHLFSGEFGLEKEGLRVTADGRFAHTPDPFAGNERIVRDFSENQTEINTGVHTTEEGALGELADLTALIHRTLDALPEKEYLWPFSNPPYIRNERDIPIAVYPPEQAGKRIYREYLSDRYGRYKMAFSGIHVNYSFSDELLRAAYEARSDEAGREAAGESADAADDRAAQEDFRRFRDELYLKLAEDLARYGWIVTALTAASLVMDGSYVEKGKTGKDTFLGMASVRCSELGYWNHFAPVFDYTSLKGYIRGVRQYVEKGYLAFPSELYYPIRVKPRGANSLELLEERGVNHIELRMVDLNPFEYSGMDIRDLKFIRYLLIWLACCPAGRMNEEAQTQAVQNFKNAAHYDLKTVKVLLPDTYIDNVSDAGRAVIAAMRVFFVSLNAGPLADVLEVLDYQEEKLLVPEKRYAWRLYAEFGDGFAEKALELAKRRQEEGLARPL